MMNPLFELISSVIHLYNYVLFGWLLLSWLISFGIVNRHQPLVQRLNFILFRLTDPLLRPIRKHMPDLDGIDISPIVLILLLNFIDRSLMYYSFR